MTMNRKEMEKALAEFQTRKAKFEAPMGTFTAELESIEYKIVEGKNGLYPAIFIGTKEYHDFIIPVFLEGRNYALEQLCDQLKSPNYNAETLKNYIGTTITVTRYAQERNGITYDNNYNFRQTSVKAFENDGLA